ncbi:sulfotransferase [Desertifilum sp. FACHB-1129]|uniref:Methyltransferase type 12 domain-containing protein n=2 Tax=Desertifilum tharense IPPAS B-1220 TaxID=1781255 RepID=A0A1E5QLN1_9CYAN|nr:MULTISPECIES: methyltransferase [Desertifilum]MDA0211981.1 sulfotransferase [Cyanobacteria bacterium FC1]MBD2313293.1 sulfotransferase [Desertifilum sp. FACHB-1129]MBD2324246.1 sulfotransferase [Desertifilum sp. FACHB-866]MBD2334260.1 sulfotransferase [Desertifilum sp. FACHB-868]OEJ75602.1 hypothetical protein BH720_08810 [Desertifilum tharense IPPAS B-1220]
MIHPSNSVIQATIQQLTSSPELFKTAICERDEMYQFALNKAEGNAPQAALRYYTNGRRIFDCVRQIVEPYFDGFQNISAFLDFACGYGRFTRFLLQELEKEKIWVSDIYPEAVKFQTEEFGVQGVYSTSQPQDYPTLRQFDCILASSFFSHIPEATFKPWLEKLLGFLDAQGLLIFSVHDIRLAPNSQGEFQFIPESESQSLAGEEYGTTYVSEAYLQQLLAEINPEFTYQRISQGLCYHQDLYVVTKQPRKPLNEIAVYHHPAGTLNHCKRTAETIELFGQVEEFNPNSQIEDIQIWTNGRLFQRCLPIEANWHCGLPRNRLKAEDVLLIKAVNSRGLERILAVDTVGSLTQGEIVATASESTILVLIGMHRSGTSLTASLLQDIGVDLGDRLVGEDVGNEKGHFEDLDFVEFHKNVLRSQSLDLDGLTLADDIPVLDRYRETAQALIEENLKHRLWGWKDPRTTLFLDFWHSLLPQANFILVYRSPWEVVDSLYRRGSDELIEAYPERAVEFWMHYNQKMLEFYAKSPERCLLINLSHIVRDPSGLIAALNQKFQLQLPPPSPDIIDLSLLSDRISHSHRPVLIEKYYPEALELYRELEAKATPFNGETEFPWMRLTANYSPKEWGFLDWLEMGNLYREQRQQRQALKRQFSHQLHAKDVKIQQTQAELQQTQAKLQETDAQMHQIHDEAQKVIQDLVNTIAQLQETQAEVERLNGELQQVRSQLYQTQGDLASSQSQLQSQLEQTQQAQAIIAAMQTSKFWQMRSSWFRLKKLVGLPLDETVD